MTTFKEKLLKEKQQSLVKHYSYFIDSIILIYWGFHVYSSHSFFSFTSWVVFIILMIFTAGTYVIITKIHINFRSLVYYYIIFASVLITLLGVMFLPQQPVLFIHLIPVPLVVYMIDDIKAAFKSTLALMLLFLSFFLITPNPKIFFFIVYAVKHPPVIALLITILPVITSTYTIMLLSFYMNEFTIIKFMPEKGGDISHIQNKYMPDSPEQEKNVLDKFDSLYRAILSYFEEKKPYQNSNFNIYMLAEELNTNRTYISNALNQKGNINFHTLINTYRIKQVKDNLDNRDYKRYTLKHISTQAGFKYQTTFNTIFKEVVGVSPSEYIQMLNDAKNQNTPQEIS